MGQHDTLLRCTLGGTAFQLESYQIRESPRLVEGIGRTGTETEVSGRGWIEGTDAADYQSKLAAAMTAFRVFGQDFSIFELNQSAALYSIIAAQCSDGGPHVAFTLEDQSGESPCLRFFTFTVSARNGSDGTFGDADPGAKTDIESAPDGLRTVRVRGELHRARASDYYRSLVNAFKATHPGSSWVVSQRYTVDERDTDLTYEITAVELRSPMPDGGAQIVDGEGSIDRDADEQGRLSIRYTYDLLLSDGDYQPVIDQIRREASSKGLIVRENTSVVRFKETRVRGTFELVTGREGNRLLNWQQRLLVVDPAVTYRETRFSGTLPVLIQAHVGKRRVVQTGTALGAGAWVVPPNPIFDLDAACEDSPPQVEYSMDNDFEFRTSWTYVMFIEINDINPWKPKWSQLLSLHRPGNPEFIGPPAPG